MAFSDENRNIGTHKNAQVKKSEKVKKKSVPDELQSSRELCQELEIDFVLLGEV